ncbi:hypothetical protein [[Kitasatospora] papulosa]|uniref:hypothetical protein n=1 Tax=[Kitasatospora] papulosa TaxID=1464011 RepID=UPI003692608D
MPGEKELPVCPDDDFELPDALGAEIHASLAWARTISSSGDPRTLELFFNPADVDGLPPGATLLGYQVRRSIGVPLGEVLVFDRPWGRYIRRGVYPGA